MISPTQRARAELKKRGWPCQIVEHWNQYARVRQDLFGIFDLVVLRPFNEDLHREWQSSRSMPSTVYTSLIEWDTRPGFEAKILGIQVTSASNRSKRREKMLASPYLEPWCASGGVAELWTYSKKGARGKAKHWTLDIEQVTPHVRITVTEAQ